MQTAQKKDSHFKTSTELRIGSGSQDAKRSADSNHREEQAVRFNRILSETADVMEQAGIHYAFIGGIAASGLGRPRSTRDIDIFVTPEDADRALDALERQGFRTERTDPSWLYKAFKENILVDVIFKSKGEIYLDSEMYDRMTVAEYHGKRLRLVAPEDLLIIKAVAHSELTPGHWHDAIALLSHAAMDWEYLVRRARRAPRRVLSLLLYAQSNDVWVPNQVIHELYFGIFGDLIQRPAERMTDHTFGIAGRSKAKDRPNAQTRERYEHRIQHEYALAHLRHALAEDPRTNELDIQIEGEGQKAILRGNVLTPERRESVEKLAREYLPGWEVENQIRILEFAEPGSEEDVK